LTDSLHEKTILRATKIKQCPDPREAIKQTISLKPDGIQISWGAA
jgi:hypothetical protein